MIYTGNYKNCNTQLLKTYSISKDKGLGASYSGPCIEKLAPKEDFFRTWKNNIGKLDDLENNKHYIIEYYNQILKKLNPEEVYKKINNSILLCYEENNEFCHRHIVSAWLEYYLNIKSYEIKVENEKLVILDRPTYIKDYLLDVIDEKTLVRKRKL